MTILAIRQLLQYTILKIVNNEANMTPEMVKSFYRSKYNFNKETGMSANTLGNWLKWGRVPEAAQYKLERITKGLLKTEWSHEPK